MISIPWSRSETIKDLREDIWRYISAQAEPQEQLLQAGALLQLNSTDIAVLAGVHFLESDSVQNLLDKRQYLSRRMATSSVDEEELSHAQIRGPIVWPRTYGARTAHGWSSNLYVTTPVRRAFQTPENELLRHVLSSIDITAARVRRHLGWGTNTLEETVGARVHRRGEAAGSWLRTRQLAEVEPKPITPRAVHAVRSGRKRQVYQEVLDVYDQLQRLVERLDRQAIRDAVEQTGLSITDDNCLFELLIFFKTLSSLSGQGWHVGNFSFVGGVQKTLSIRCQREDEQLEVWYQRPPSELSRNSIRTDVLKDHGVKVGTTRPDVIMRRSKSGIARWILIECKRYDDPNNGARAAVTDLLAYRRSFNSELIHSVGTYGIGAVWGADLSPIKGEIILATPDKLASALAIVFENL